MASMFKLAIMTGIRQYLRNPLFMILMIGLPPVFITLSFLTTPDQPFVLPAPEGAQRILVSIGMIDLHGAIMVPITVAFLSGLLGLFVMLGARQGDRRLVISGFPPMLLLLVRLLMIFAMCLVITAISVGVMLINLKPEQLGLFFIANLIQALEYGFIGAIVGTYLSAMSGTYLVFFAPMIDVGLVQNPMFFRENVDLWVKFLPGYAPMEVLMDVSFTQTFDTGFSLLISLVYCLAIVIVSGVLFSRVMTVHR